MLGIGFAAFRDVAAFFKNAKQDAEGTPNPLAGQITWAISRGRSQSGNYLRAFLHFGFNEDLDRTQSLRGRLADHRRRPDHAEHTVRAAGWHHQAVRGRQGRAGVVGVAARSGARPARQGRPHSLHGHQHLSEDHRTHGLCGSVGAGADPGLGGDEGRYGPRSPSNVRRYYIASTQHGGGQGGFNVTPATTTPMCPGANYGSGMFPANPVPHTETFNALRVHFRDWVMKDVAPPPSRWPTLKDGYLVDATKEAMGFPTIPGVPATAPTGLQVPLLDYDWGPDFKYDDAAGVPTKVPPAVKHVIKGKVPRVDADGNELGGVPVVLRDAPLGTYLGWNVTAAGFHKGKICGYAGGMIPFAKTRAERMANGDPRLSLEERYKTHDGYVAVVKTAAAKAVSEGFLLQPDADRLIAAAAASNVLNDGEGSSSR